MPGDKTSNDEERNNEAFAQILADAGLSAQGTTTRSKSAERAPLTIEVLTKLLIEMERRMTTTLIKTNNSTQENINIVNQTIKNMDESTKAQFTGLETKLLAHEKSVANALKEFQTMRSEVAALKVELEGLKSDPAGAAGVSAEVAALRTELEQLKAAGPAGAGSDSELSLVKEELEEMRQYTRNRNLIIDGVPPAPGENLSSLFLRMGQALNMNIDPNDIEAIHRLPPRKVNTNRAPSILVQVKTRPLRDSFVLLARKKKFKLADIGHTSTGNIYVSEHLTSHRSHLYYQARMVKKNYNFTYVWVKGGKIFLKKDDTPESKAVEVKSMAVLDHLKTVK